MTLLLSLTPYLYLTTGANIPASDPFRLTPLLLAKLKLDNLRQVQHIIHNEVDENNNSLEIEVEWISSSAKHEYNDLKQVSPLTIMSSFSGY